MAVINHQAELARAGANVTGFWGQAMFLARRYPLGAVGFVIVLIFVLTAALADVIAGERELTDFDRGVSRFAWLMIRFILVMAPLVFVINAATLRARGYPPSVREIAKAVGLASTSAVHHHLEILEREGYLERGEAQSRALRLTPNAALKLGLSSELMPGAMSAEAHVVPIVGEIAAGGPIEAYQDASESMAIPDILAPTGDAYVLRVRGDSMIDAHIEDGDFVLIRPQTTARDGQVVSIHFFGHRSNALPDFKVTRNNCGQLLEMDKGWTEQNSDLPRLVT